MILDLDEQALSDIRSVTTALNHDGLRVVGVAKDMPPMREAYGINDERDLTLVGYIAFLDPPKESAALRAADIILLEKSLMVLEEGARSPTCSNTSR